MKKKILAISGSTRKSSTNYRILEFLQDSISQDSQYEVEIFEGVDTIPHFSEDQDRTPPDEVISFQRKLIQCPGVLICSPEYVFSLPGSFKNSLDWLVSTTVLSNKPLAMIVAAASGEEAFRSLRKICETLGASINDECALLVQGARGKMDPEGKPIPELRSQLIDLQDSFLEQLAATESALQSS